jgi:hypothetical protein
LKYLEARTLLLNSILSSCALATIATAFTRKWEVNPQSSVDYICKLWGGKIGALPAMLL